jgi:hypothetical protein
MSKKRLAFGIGSWVFAVLFAYQAIGVGRRPLTFMGNAKGHFAVTDEKWLLEMGEALDKLGELGYSDGQGNRLKIGDDYRELIRQRRQDRLAYWAIAGFFGIIGLVAVVKRPRPAPTPSTPAALSESEVTAARLAYAQLPTARLRQLLDSSADLRPGAAELVQEELDRRGDETSGASQPG